MWSSAVLCCACGARVWCALVAVEATAVLAALRCVSAVAGVVNGEMAKRDASLGLTPAPLALGTRLAFPIHGRAVVDEHVIPDAFQTPWPCAPRRRLDGDSTALDGAPADCPRRMPSPRRALITRPSHGHHTASASPPRRPPFMRRRHMCFSRIHLRPACPCVHLTSSPSCPVPVSPIQLRRRWPTAVSSLAAPQSSSSPSPRFPIHRPSTLSTRPQSPPRWKEDNAKRAQINPFPSTRVPFSSQPPNTVLPAKQEAAPLLHAAFSPSDRSILSTCAPKPMPTGYCATAAIARLGKRVRRLRVSPWRRMVPRCDISSVVTMVVCIEPTAARGAGVNCGSGSFPLCSSRSGRIREFSATTFILRLSSDSIRPAQRLFRDCNVVVSSASSSRTSELLRSVKGTRRPSEAGKAAHD
ncbi:hypothetical protein K505DRAFT_416304 [Melanomma pulvis-pyrius CBS 109.77]|uniref:Uncharacterized protein n=1 Tax=Melanomma pulvis-pyrius CBS 109.77 TaxID=1314802 RepID=A0A6A6XGA6_9PLEO|nr:hypothetical protein K505DRAFT_416304 [Melanomma pulvis-pyrius CBS 109.77]